MKIEDLLQMDGGACIDWLIANQYKFELFETNEEEVECAIVPLEDIKKLEVARKNLYRMFEGTIHDLVRVERISAPMWQITHRKYPTIIMEKKEVTPVITTEQ